MQTYLPAKSVKEYAGRARDEAQQNLDKWYEKASESAAWARTSMNTLQDILAELAAWQLAARLAGQEWSKDQILMHLGREREHVESKTHATTADLYYYQHLGNVTELVDNYTK